MKILREITYNFTAPLWCTKPKEFSLAGFSPWVFLFSEGSVCVTPVFKDGYKGKDRDATSSALFTHQVPKNPVG